MPILAILLLVANVTCAVHVVRTGRPLYWLMLIFLLPGVGALVYFIAEMGPALGKSKTVTSVASNVIDFADPNRDLRKSAVQLEDLGTIDNKVAMAEQLQARGEYQSAAQIYESCLTGPTEDDAAILLRLATCLYLTSNYDQALERLDQIQAAHPSIQSQEGHLLYARTLDALGYQDGALNSYEDLVDGATTEEPRCRYALLLQKAGQVLDAHDQFAIIVRNIDKGGAPYKRSQREWYRLAKRHL